MTAKTSKKAGKTEMKARKRLSLSRATLKDLSSPDGGPKGGMGIRVVKSHCTTCPASCRR